MVKDKLVQGIIENLAKCQRPALSGGWRKLGLSHAQVGMLFLLSYHEDSSVKDVADFLGVSKSAVTQLLEPLVKKGFVSRNSDPKDRRVARLNLTRSGKQMLNTLAKHKFAGLRSRLESLNSDELKQLDSLCRKMSETAA